MCPRTLPSLLVDLSTRSVLLVIFVHTWARKVIFGHINYLLSPQSKNVNFVKLANSADQLDIIGFKSCLLNVSYQCLHRTESKFSLTRPMH